MLEGGFIRFGENMASEEVHGRASGAKPAEAEIFLSLHDQKRGKFTPFVRFPRCLNFSKEVYCLLSFS